MTAYMFTPPSTLVLQIAHCSNSVLVRIHVLRLAPILATGENEGTFDLVNTNICSVPLELDAELTVAVRDRDMKGVAGVPQRERFVGNLGAGE